MDFNDTPDQAKFREKCRTWLENNAPYKDGSAKMESFCLLYTSPSPRDS